MPDLEYTITEVKLLFLYDFCRDSLLNKRKDEVVDGKVVLADHYEQVDASPWRANEAYHLYWSGGYIDRYLVCYENRIIEITFSWEPTSSKWQLLQTNYWVNGKSMTFSADSLLS